MHDIHQALDGERRRGELTSGERRELAAYRAVIAGTLASLPGEVPPGIESAVMARVRAAASARVPAAVADPRGMWARVRAALDWLWAPRSLSLSFRPAYAALVLALALGASLGPRPWGAAPARARVFVHFRLDAPGARAVSLAGDFTGWQPRYRLHEGAPGVWSVVVPLEPGVHDYAFVVDGTSWRPDPLAPAVADGFGGTNSRVAVLAPVSGRNS